MKKSNALGSQRQLGYVVDRIHGHPLADAKGRVMQHRRVMYDLLGPGPHPCVFCGVELPFRTGRKVAGIFGIEVDHINADRTDNRPENLVLVCPPHNTVKGMQGDHIAKVLEVVA